jgi:hypothetical protein
MRRPGLNVRSPSFEAIKMPFARSGIAGFSFFSSFFLSSSTILLNSFSNSVVSFSCGGTGRAPLGCSAGLMVGPSTGAAVALAGGVGCAFAGGGRIGSSDLPCVGCAFCASVIVEDDST